MRWMILAALLSGCTIRFEMLPERKPDVTREEIKAALSVRDQAIQGLAQRIESDGKEKEKR